ncbi:MAG: hypothetical protein CFE34_15970 [Rhodobacteraceae bacterium PARR1]|nr:MAG: hypothetical protein CFE34_15970 [Rhodobacteraceae bacterium PARR1]
MPHDPLQTALDDLRARLIAGDYATLPALAERIEGLMLGLRRSDAARLRRMRAQTIQTAACVDAARNGFRAARRRIEEATGRAPLGTYDSAGTRAPLVPSMPPARRV